MTPVNIDLKTFGKLQRRAERVRIKVRRFESGGVTRLFSKTRGVSSEIESIEDLEALLGHIAILEGIHLKDSVEAQPHAEP